MTLKLILEAIAYTLIYSAFMLYKNEWFLSQGSTHFYFFHT